RRTESSIGGSGTPPGGPSAAAHPAPQRSRHAGCPGCSLRCRSGSSIKERGGM
ncbi:uncharacterized protein METZ01_LOCUS58152, partial [marine metagenome]